MRSAVKRVWMPSSDCRGCLSAVVGYAMPHGNSRQETRAHVNRHTANALALGITDAFRETGEKIKVLEENSA